MSADNEKSLPKWLVKFKHTDEHANLLVDLKESDLFNFKYPVFKMQLANEILNSKAKQYYHIKRESQPVEIRDPTGKEVPLGSCVFILGISSELGMVKLLFIPQPEERLVLVGLDEVWIKVLKNIEESQRLNVVTNVAASLATKKEVWGQVYLIY